MFVDYDAILDAPLFGSVTWSTTDEGHFVYTPPADWVGTDSFTYRASDGINASFTAMVTIDVTGEVPVAQNDSVVTVVDAPLTIDIAADLLSNDSDADGDAFDLESFDAASAVGGTIVDNGDGTLTYTHPAGYTGNDEFEYVIEDDTGMQGTAIVNITVLPDGPAVSVADVTVVEGDSGTTDAVFTITLSESSSE